MELLRRILFRIPNGTVPKIYPFSTNTAYLSTTTIVTVDADANLLKDSPVLDSVPSKSTDLTNSSVSNLTSINLSEEPDKLYKLVELECRSNDAAVLKSFQKFAVTAGNHFDLESKAWTLRKPLHERYTVLKSVHIYKKHRVQYEFRTYFSFVQFKKLTGSTADTLLEYIERNLPEGVALKVTKVEIQKYPEHLKPPEATLK